MCSILSKARTKTPEQCQWHHNAFIVNFEGFSIVEFEELRNYKKPLSKNVRVLSYEQYSKPFKKNIATWKQYGTSFNKNGE